MLRFIYISKLKLTCALKAFVWATCGPLAACLTCLPLSILFLQICFIRKFTYSHFRVKCEMWIYTIFVCVGITKCSMHQEVCITPAFFSLLRLCKDVDVFTHEGTTCCSMYTQGHDRDSRIFLGREKGKQSLKGYYYFLFFESYVSVSLFSELFLLICFPQRFSPNLFL